MPTITVRQLYQDNQEKLGLSWLAGSAGADNVISNDESKATRALVGHLNFIHPNRVQVLGVAEIEYFERLEQAAAKTALDQLFHKSMAVVIVANQQPIPKLLRDYCHHHHVPLMSSPQESPHLMDVLRLYLARVLAVSTVLHGVFLDVFEVGVLITGESAMGKSELALELISRGHGLVADDAVELFKIGPETIEGRCPQLLRDFLEVRGLGILNIRTVFGETAVRPRKTLRLMIHLIKASDQLMQSLDRLNIQAETQDVLGVKIRKVILPVAAGRNLAVLVETAVRNYILHIRGLDTTREFIERHTHHMKEQNNHAPGSY
jgi:HPr kinase/phosphorylase